MFPLTLKAVAFDLDDTLLRDDLSISDRTVRTLRTLDRKGVHILPCSGRAMESMRPFVQRIGCASRVIACNGAEIYSGDFRPLHASLLPLNAALAILAFGASRQVYMQTYDGGSFYYNHNSPYADMYARTARLRGVCIPDLSAFVTLHPTSKILMMDDPDRISEMRGQAEAMFSHLCSVTTSKSSYLEFNPLHASKGSALGICAKELGFSMENLIAYGDSLNDLSMLTGAGEGVAVGNARDEVIRACVRVAPTNGEDGVAVDLLRHYPQFFDLAEGGCP